MKGENLNLKSGISHWYSAAHWWSNSWIRVKSGNCCGNLNFFVFLPEEVAVQEQERAHRAQSSAITIRITSKIANVKTKKANKKEEIALQ